MIISDIQPKQETKILQNAFAIKIFAFTTSCNIFIYRYIDKDSQLYSGQNENMFVNNLNVHPSY